MSWIMELFGVLSVSLPFLLFPFATVSASKKRTTKKPAQKITASGQHLRIAVSQIRPNPFRVGPTAAKPPGGLRGWEGVAIHPTKLDALRRSEKEYGFWETPFHVFPNGAENGKPLYSLLFGHTRFVLVAETGAKHVDCIVYSGTDSRTALRMMNEENRQEYGGTTAAQVESIDGIVKLFAKELPALRASGEVKPLHPMTPKARIANAENPFVLVGNGGKPWSEYAYRAEDVAEFARVDLRTVRRHMAALAGIYATRVSTAITEGASRDDLETIGKVGEAIASQSEGIVTDSMRKSFERWATESVPSVAAKSDLRREASEAARDQKMRTTDKRKRAAIRPEPVAVLAPFEYTIDADTGEREYSLLSTPEQIASAIVGGRFELREATDEQKERDTVEVMQSKWSAFVRSACKVAAGTSAHAKMSEAVAAFARAWGRAVKGDTVTMQEDGTVKITHKEKVSTKKSATKKSATKKSSKKSASKEDDE